MSLSLLYAVILRVCEFFDSVSVSVSRSLSLSRERVRVRAAATYDVALPPSQLTMTLFCHSTRASRRIPLLPCRKPCDFSNWPTTQFWRNFYLRAGAFFEPGSSEGLLSPPPPPKCDMRR